jgi:hypothetical protein
LLARAVIRCRTARVRRGRVRVRCSLSIPGTRARSLVTVSLRRSGSVASDRARLRWGRATFRLQVKERGRFRMELRIGASRSLRSVQL